MHVHRRTIDSIIVTVWARCQFERHCTADRFKHNFTASRLFARTPLYAQTTTSQDWWREWCLCQPSRMHTSNTQNANDHGIAGALRVVIAAVQSVHAWMASGSWDEWILATTAQLAASSSAPHKHHPDVRASESTSTSRSCRQCCRLCAGYTHALARVPTEGSIRWIMHAHGNDVTIRTC